MDVIAWIIWAGGWVLSVVGSLVWLLIGGWVSTAAQVLAVLAGFTVWRYGWRRAPVEMVRQLTDLARFVRGWLGRHTPAQGGRERQATDDSRRPVMIHYKEWGDVNLSTLMTLAMAIGFWAVAIAG